MDLVQLPAPAFCGCSSSTKGYMIHDTYVIIYIYNIIQKPVGCCFMLFQHEFDSSEISEKKRENMLVPLISLSCCPRFSEGSGLGKKGGGPVVSAVNML